MGKTPTIIPITDLRKDAAAVLGKVRESGEPVFITQRGRAAAVMISAEAYDQVERTRELLRLLAQGEKEAARGKGHSLREVLAAADNLLRG